ncbi:PREDICTED: palmitoyl-protein thioesterase 1-like [Erythranthe guttata]|nr:PREDICTED: palmitoyl-protein thioesterase 1-like [Erythranthe guttata]|eukprot:XP_012827283.1 PREDICTED: palmitoyl-protein thioesterase 1-like [Erythranthe guttata]
MVNQSETRSSHIVVIIFTFTVLIVHAYCWRPFYAPLPFILLHGVNNQCSSSQSTLYVKQLSEWSNTTGYCLEIGNGVQSSWLIPLEKQVEEACKKVKAMKELSKGYNIVGLSQGTLIGRGIIEFCEEAPPVNNFISIGGPQAGIASVPHSSVSENDTVITPKESSWFGFYEDGSTNNILQPKKTKLYVEDWIGLKTLDKAGRVKFIKVGGTHIEVSDADMKKYVVPFLHNKWRRLAEAEYGGDEAVNTTNSNAVGESNKLGIINEGNM